MGRRLNTRCGILCSFTDLPKIHDQKDKENKENPFCCEIVVSAAGVLRQCAPVHTCVIPSAVVE
jgi:hypothetical protein